MGYLGAAPSLQSYAYLVHKMKKIILAIILLLHSVVGAQQIVITAFNAGEFSPLLEGRVDLKKYYTGCATLENMVVLPHGGVTKRPGSYYIAEAKNSATSCRLVAFEYSTTQAYILEFGNLYIRYYKDGSQITDGGSAVETTTTYTTAQLFDLQFVQSADELYIVHPGHEPAKLTRTSHTAWTLTDITFERGPFRPENITSTTITPSATTGSITLTSSSSIFGSDHVGSYWRITHTVEGTAASGSKTTETSSSSQTVREGQSYDFTTHGTWTGTVKLQRSYDDGSTWKDVLVYASNDDRNVTYSDIEDVNDAVYRFTVTDYGSGKVYYNLMVHSFDVDGVVEITAYTSGTVVTGTVEYDLGDTTATKYWAEGAWSDDEGWPTTIAFFEERQVYAATTNSPQTLWFSQTDDWDNFLSGPDDTDAMTITIASDQVNSIRWLSPQSSSLLIGTAGGEWTLGSSGSEAALTPSNINARRHSGHGSAALQPAIANDRVVFVQRQDQKVRRMGYSWESDSWVSQDITLLSEHITGEGITQLAWQKNPYPILWCVREDGALVGVTLEENNEVIGWHRHELGGDVGSAAVIPGTGEDELWIVVERSINSATKRYIEQVQPFDWGSDQRDVFMVDSGLSFDGGASITVTSITQADPAVVTATAHGFTDGEQVRLSDVSGMVEVNNQIYTVDDAATNTFSLDDASSVGNIDSTGFTAYTSGGSAEAVENTFSTLTHLDNEDVIICGDGGYEGAGTVSGSGGITLDYYYNTVHIGKSYTAKLRTLPLSSGGTAEAFFGKNKRITEVTLRLYNTLACDIGPSWTSYDSYVFRDASDSLEAPPPLYSGDSTLIYRGNYDTDARLFIQSRYPVPLTVLALGADVRTSR